MAASSNAIPRGRVNHNRGEGRTVQLQQPLDPVTSERGRSPSPIIGAVVNGLRAAEPPLPLHPKFKGPGFAAAKGQPSAKADIRGKLDGLVFGAQDAIRRQDGVLRAIKNERLKAVLSALATTVAAMTAYVIMIVVWFRVYRYSFMWTLGVFLAIIIGSMALIVTPPRFLGRLGNLGKNARFRWFWVFVAQGAVVGLVVGFLIYFQKLAYYFRYQDLRTYTNVGGSQSPAAFRDASMILFTEDTRLDPMRSVGFKSQWTGQSYCVAPIVDSTTQDGDPVTFWAVGENCCLPRGSFSCDDAQDPLTRSALILLEPEDVVRPFMQWAVAGAVYPRYEKAFNLQQATYNMGRGPEVKLVRWSRDPVALKETYYASAKDTCIWVSVVYFFLVSIAASLVAYTTRHIIPTDPIYREAPPDSVDPSWNGKPGRSPGASDEAKGKMSRMMAGSRSKFSSMFGRS